MKAFVLIFRTNQDAHAAPSPEQIQERANWMKNIVSQNKLVDKGNRLTSTPAKTVTAEKVTEGPYKSKQEYINGYMVVKAATIDEAAELAQSNPILKMGGSVEVRAVVE